MTDTKCHSVTKGEPSMCKESTTFISTFEYIFKSLVRPGVTEHDYSLHE